MKNKNQFVVVGLLAGLAIFGSTASQAAQTCLEMQGELHLISVEGKIRESLNMEYDLRQDNRIRLNEKAMMICSDSQFCVESTSIKTTFFFHPWTRIGQGSMKAVVNCLK